MAKPARLLRILFIPDCHIPYEDRKAWALMLKAARRLRPDTIVVLGDFLDFYSVSAHDKDPRRVRLLDEEIRCGNERLSELDALGATRKVFIKGNHEWRLERYLMTRAPELFNLVRMRDLLKLDERGWECVEYREHARIGRLYATHDAGKAGDRAHAQALADFQSNVVIGHTHRLGYAVVGSAKGKAHVGAMFGWLGDENRADYMHRIKALRDWAKGFGVGYMDQATGVVHVRPVPIVLGSVVLDGVLIRGD